MVLPVPVAGQPGAMAIFEAVRERYERGDAYIDILDPVFGVVEGGADTSAALNVAYQAADLAGLPLLWRAGTYGFASNIDWESNTVGFISPGSGLVTLQAIGTAQINLKPSSFTVTPGPRVGGFTVQGDASGPAGAVGIATGDTTGFVLDDIVVQRFTGAGSIGVLVDTAQQTELNHYGHIRTSNCTVGIKFTNSNPAQNSLARFNFTLLHLDVQAGQVGWQMRDEVIMYGGTLNIVGNMDGAGTFFDIGFGTSDSCGINGGAWSVACEQTSGSGGVPYKVGANAYAFAESGFARFEGLGPGVVTGGARHVPGWRIPTPQAVIAGVDDQVEGTIANFLGSGKTATMHPLLWDVIQDPWATIGVLTGDTIRAPYVCMFDSAASAFVIYKIGSGAPSNVSEILRVTTQGHVIVSGGGAPTADISSGHGAALGTSPPAPQTSGNNDHGTISLGTGTATAAGYAVRVNFANPWPVVPEIVLTPLTGPSHDVKVQPGRGAAYFDLYFNVAPLASQPLGTYAWSFHAKG